MRFNLRKNRGGGGKGVVLRHMRINLRKIRGFGHILWDHKKKNLRYFAMVPYLNMCSVKVTGYKLYIFIGAFKDSLWNRNGVTWVRTLVFLLLGRCVAYLNFEFSGRTDERTN